MATELTSEERNDYNVSTFCASYCTMTTSYLTKAPLTEDNALDVVYLGMCDSFGNFVEVPCTYMVADIIRHYGTGVKLTLYISPRVKANGVGDLELLPLCIGASRAV